MKDSVYARLRSDSQQHFSVTDGGAVELGAGDLLARVSELAGLLDRIGARRIALLADNGIDWIIADLACDRAARCVVPLPLFFSDDQLVAALRNSGVDTLLTDQAERVLSLLDGVGAGWHLSDSGRLAMFSLDNTVKADIPPETRKITYTSGTTGAPKGVCLGADQQLTVAGSLIEATGLARPRHLCLLPLSTLLENVAGVYAPLLAGGTVIAPSLSRIGFNGSSRLDADRFLRAIALHRPQSLILVPEMLAVLVAAAEHGWQVPEALEFVAVGGSKVAAAAIERAWAVGLPVYEGYGLSECCSVVSLNRPGANRPGSAGRPLAHLDVRVEDGEVVVGGATFLGYVGDPHSWNGRTVRTGDLGRIDADGLLCIDGRSKNVLISSFGRNISPEWVESELLAGDVLRQAFVFGDAKAYCVALLVPRNPRMPDTELQDWINRVNARLPDYARISGWRRLADPLTSRAGLLTENGRPRRDRIAGQFRQILTEMFDIPREGIAL